MSLARWVMAASPSVARAKLLAELLPPSPTGRGAEVPFPYADRSAYESLHSNHEINAAIEAAPKVIVPIKGLRAIQHSVKVPKLVEHLTRPREPGARHPDAGTPTDLPIVVQQGGVRYLHDGHHRATAALLMGRKSIRVRLVNFDAGATRVAPSE